MNLEDIQDRILEQLQEGGSIDRDALLTTHQEHADALRQFFGVLDIVEADAPGEEDVPSRLGEFRIVREIGRGGMGIVFEAEQTSLKRRVALKVLPTALRSDRRLLSRFRREAEAAARLRHPNIVPVYSIGQAGNAPFFAMEMVAGESLAEVLAQRCEGRDGGLPEDAGEYQRRCVEIVGQLADALAYAHGEGILHRDVKPANVLLEADGTPRLTDFGLAADLEASSLTLSGEVFGSPRYMSPEQAFRCEAPLDARTDVYSLGVTLYEMLTLRLPYSGTTTSELLAALSSGKVVSPRECGIELPEGLERVLMRALCHDLEERYAGAAEFAEDLRAALQGRAAKPRRRRRRPLLTAALCLVAGPGSFLAMDLYLNHGHLDVTRSLWRSIWGDGIERVSWQQVEALADGEPQSDEVMTQLFQPSVHVRTVLVRNRPFAVAAAMTVTGGGLFSWRDSRYDLIDAHEGQIVASCVLEFSVNGGPWERPEPCGVLLTEYALGYDGEQRVPVSYNGNDYFDGQQDRASLHVAHRVTIRVFRLEDGESVEHGMPIGSAPGQFPLDVDRGTSRQWTFPEQSVFCYDEYPADFPEALSDPALRDAAQWMLTPEYVVFDRTQSSPTGGSIFVIMHYAAGPTRTAVPLAGNLELLASGSDAVIASGEMRIGGRSYAMSRRGGTMRFVDEQSEASQRFLLAWAQRDLQEVRLVLRPSRAVALRENPMPRYWAEPVEVTVPVHYEDR